MQPSAPIHRKPTVYNAGISPDIPHGTLSAATSDCSPWKPSFHCSHQPCYTKQPHQCSCLPMRGPTKHRNSSSPRQEIDGETATLAHRYPTDTPTLPSHHTPQSTQFLSLKGSERSPAIPPLLLLLSGDIEINPGPPPKNTHYPCPTCAEPYSRRKGQLPVLAASRGHATPKSALGCVV